MTKYIVLFSILVLGSCYTRKEGCLDTLASNYDVASDDACTACCTYPKLILNIDKVRKIGSIDTTLFNKFNQAYIIQDVRFYISEFSLYQNQNQIKINEVIGTANNTFIAKNDMKILRSVDASLEIGTIKAYGQFDSLSFYLGLNKDLLSNTFVNLPTNHVLSTTGKLLDNNDETAVLTLRYKFKSPSQKDSIFNVAIPYETLGGNSFKYVVKDKANLSTTLKGADFKATIRADYKVLLDNVNLNWSKDSISQAIGQNIKSILTVK